MPPPATPQQQAAFARKRSQCSASSCACASMICLACACVSCTTFGSTGDARPNASLRGSSDELAPVRTPMLQLAWPAHRNHRSPPRRLSLIHI
eukprot:8661080-Alexandrium_andersonii.AAC.1